MPLDISDAENSWLIAQESVREFQAGFIANWFAPMMRLQMALLWAALPDEVKAELQRISPEAYSQVAGEEDHGY